MPISCNTSDCENGLHCFRITRKKENKYPDGSCQVCNAKLIQTKRIRTRNLSDAKFTFRSLKKEWIRHFWWHEPINLRALNYAKRKGLINLRKAVHNRILHSVGLATPWRDGGQTPFRNLKNPIFYAQHATASCCRKCINFWHGIPLQQNLEDNEIDYLTELIMLYFKDRLPKLTIEGEYVPPIHIPK